MNDSAERLWRSLRERSLIDESFHPSKDLDKDLDFDSLMRTELSVLLDEEWGISAKQEILCKIKTGTDLLNLLSTRETSKAYNKKSTDWSERIRETPSATVEHLWIKRNRVQRMFVTAIKRVVLLLMQLCFQLKIEGPEKIPNRGPLLICPNHQSFLDPLLLYALLPDETLYIAYEGSFRKGPLSWIVRFSRLLLTGKGGTVPDCLKLAYEGLRRGMIVCVFPEGTRTNRNGLMKPKLGTGVLSCESTAPILPVLIEGASKVLSPLHPQFRFCKIRLRFGDPIVPPKNHSTTEKNYSQALELWTQAILRMQNQGGRS